MPDARTREAAELMTGFAERTGLTSKRPAQRYLWTDAFAVCNLLGLARATGDENYTALALALIEAVHRTLGRHRPDHPGGGWISGLGDSEGEAHPTRGGLRIGKQLPERGPREPYDDRLEWERDGQYFHYLTKWMHALDQASRATADPAFNLWARELAETAYGAFTYPDPAGGGARRMHWKMSIDLGRPLVASMGQHDPLDGYVTFLQLKASAARLPGPAAGPGLTGEIGGLAAMVQAGSLATSDPLGIGGLLVDAYHLQQLIERGELADDGLLASLLSASLEGLDYFTASGELLEPAERRLAFRELGLAIGLRAARSMLDEVSRDVNEPVAGDAPLEALAEYTTLADRIESFWRKPAHQATRLWREHRDINEVMLATSLAPGGFLMLLPLE